MHHDPLKYVGHGKKWKRGALGGGVAFRRTPNAASVYLNYTQVRRN